MLSGKQRLAAAAIAGLGAAMGLWLAVSGAAQESPERKPRRPFGGVVVSVDEGAKTLTLSTGRRVAGESGTPSEAAAEETMVVSVANATMERIDHPKNSSLTANDHVAITARNEPGFLYRSFSAEGRFVESRGGQLHFAVSNGAIRVIVGRSAKVLVERLTATTLDQIKVGEHVRGAGTPRDDGVVEAQVLWVLPTPEPAPQTEAP